MDLRGYRLMQETDGEFHVRLGDGSTLRVAKRGLGRALQQKIRGYADGGEVEPAFVTGDPALDAILARPEPTALPRLTGGVTLTDAGPGINLTDPAAIDAQITGADLSGPPRSAMASILGPEWERRFTEANERPPTGADFVPPAWQPPQAATPFVSPAAPAESPAVDSFTFSPPVGAPGRAGGVPGIPRVQGMPGAPGIGGMPRGGGVAGELAAGRAQQAAGLNAQAEAAAAEGQRQAEILAETEQRRAAAQKDYETRLADLQAKGDTLYQNIIDKKVDPRRLWHSASTGSKITASIGMILGGIGSALTGGPNYAVEVIDRAIARDIDGQKAEIEKGQNLLAHNLRQTDDLRLAHQLTRADLLDSSAAQLQRAAASFAGEKAQAAATVAIGNLRAEAAKERQAVAATQQQMAAQARLLPLQVEQAERQVAMQRLQTQALGQMFSGVGSPVPREAIALLPDAVRERVVYLPGGNATLASTKEGAAKVRDQVQGYQEITGAVADMRRLRKEYGRSWVPFTAERAEGESMRRKMIGALRLAVVGPGAMNESELKILENLIPTPGERFLTDDAFEAKLRQIEQKAYDGMWAGLSAQTGEQIRRLNMRSIVR